MGKLYLCHSFPTRTLKSSSFFRQMVKLALFAFMEGQKAQRRENVR